jgi:hypothetical protein
MHKVRIVITLAASLAIAAASSAAASDVSSTHAYIQANYALAKAGVAHIGVVQAKVQALNASLAQSCPHAGAGSPELESSQPMSSEVVVALWATTYAANAGPIATFASKTKQLRWSNGRITRMVSRYARSLHEMATLRMPDLCTDVRSWQGTGFTVIPPGVAALDDHAESIQLEPVPAGLLRSSARGSDASVLARAVALELKLEESEFSLGQDDWLLLLETLSMHQ